MWLRNSSTGLPNAGYKNRPVHGGKREIARRGLVAWSMPLVS